MMSSLKSSPASGTHITEQLFLLPIMKFAFICHLMYGLWGYAIQTKIKLSHLGALYPRKTHEFRKEILKKAEVLQIHYVWVCCCRVGGRFQFILLYVYWFLLPWCL